MIASCQMLSKSCLYEDIVQVPVLAQEVDRKEARLSSANELVSSRHPFF